MLPICASRITRLLHVVDRLTRLVRNPWLQVGQGIILCLCTLVIIGVICVFHGKAILVDGSYNGDLALAQRLIMASSISLQALAQSTSAQTAFCLTSPPDWDPFRRDVGAFIQAVRDCENDEVTVAWTGGTGTGLMWQDDAATMHVSPTLPADWQAALSRVADGSAHAHPWVGNVTADSNREPVLWIWQRVVCDSATAGMLGVKVNLLPIIQELFTAQPSRTWLLSSSGAYSYETQFRSYATAQPMTAALFHELATESETSSAGVHAALGQYLAWRTVPLGDGVAFLAVEYTVWSLLWVAKFTVLGLVVATPVFVGLCGCAFCAWRHSRRFCDLQEALAMSEDGTREFLSMFSHEMRTPLNHIIGVVPLLKNSVPESEYRLLDAISTGSKALLDKINDVLDFAGMCAKPVKLAPETLHIRRCVDDVVAMYAPPARDKGLYMTVNVEAEVPTFVVADGRRLQQALSKLLSNALKFTEHGRIELRVCPNPEAFGGGLEFRVLDSGVGMDVHEVPAALEAFRQLDMSSTRRFEGAGLGLFICRRLVARWGGRLEVRAMGRHRGLEVAFTYPSRGWGVPLRLPPSSSPRKPALVVCQCPKTSQALGNMLSWMDMEVTLLMDITSLLDQLRRASPPIECVVLASTDFSRSEFRVAAQKLSVALVHSILKANAAAPPTVVLVAPVFPLDLRQLGDPVVCLKSPPQHADLWEVVTHGRPADITPWPAGAEPERPLDPPSSSSRLQPRPPPAEVAVVETVLSEPPDDQPLTDASGYSDTTGTDATNLSRAARERLRRKHFTKMTLAKGVGRAKFTRVNTMNALPIDGQTARAPSPPKDPTSPSPKASPSSLRPTAASPTRNLTYPGMIIANCGVVRVEDPSLPSHPDAQHAAKFVPASALAASSSLSVPALSCGSNSPDEVRRCSAVSASFGDSELGSVDSMDGTDWLPEELSSAAGPPAPPGEPGRAGAPDDGRPGLTASNLELRLQQCGDVATAAAAAAAAPPIPRPAVPPPPSSQTKPKAMLSDASSASRTASPIAGTPRASTLARLRPAPLTKAPPSNAASPAAAQATAGLGRIRPKSAADLVSPPLKPTADPASPPLKPAADPASPPLKPATVVTPGADLNALSVPVTEAARAGPGAGLRMLVVDDVEVNRRLLGLMLRKLGCAVDTANDGLEACAACQAARYSVVFMDCTMPNMDGWAATKAIRRYVGYHSTPILAVTALASEDDMRKCHDSGMDGVLCKPITPAMIQQAVAKWAPPPAQRVPAESLGPIPALDVPTLALSAIDASAHLLYDNPGPPALPRHAMRSVWIAGLGAMLVVLAILAGLGGLLWASLAEQVRVEAVGRVQWIAGVQTTVYNDLIDGRLQAMDAVLAILQRSGALETANWTHPGTFLNVSGWALRLLPGAAAPTAALTAYADVLSAARYINGSGQVVLTAPTADLRAAALLPSLASLPLYLISGQTLGDVPSPAPYAWHWREPMPQPDVLLSAMRQATTQAQGFLMDRFAAVAYTDIPALRGVVLTLLPLGHVHAAFLQQLLAPLALTAAAFLVPLLLLTLTNRRLLAVVTADLRRQRDWYAALLRESAACLARPGRALQEALALRLLDERLDPTLQGNLLEMHTATSEYALLTDVIQSLHCPRSQGALDPLVDLDCERVLRHFLGEFGREIRQKGLEPLLTMSTDFPATLQLPQHGFQLVASLALALALRHLRLASPTLEVQLQFAGGELLLSVGDVHWRPHPVRRIGKANPELSTPVKARLKLLRLLLARLRGRLVLHPQDHPDACLIVCVMPAAAPLSVVVGSPVTASQDPVLLLTDDEHVASECSADGLSVERATNVEELRHLLQERSYLGTVIDLRHPAVQALDITSLRSEFQSQAIVAVADEDGCQRARQAGFAVALPESFTTRDLSFAFSRLTASPTRLPRTTSLLLRP